MEEFDYEKVIEEFEARTKDAGGVQRETLRKILEENGGTEYLQKWGLDGRTDPESFKAFVPVVINKDLDPYIQRIADGDASPILTGKSISIMSLRSGTTQGKPKSVPFNDHLMEFIMQLVRTSFAFRNREFPIGNGKALMFIFSGKPLKTKGGLTMATISTFMFRSPQFKNAMKVQYCSPDEVVFGPDFHQSLYCHLLCGLIYCDEVQFMYSCLAHTMVHAFRTFEQVWEELCTDIRDGVLSSRVTVPSIQTAMSKLLKPNPELADMIYKKCSGLSNWYGLIPELFPNVKYIYGIMTGSMEPYVKKLRHYAGGLPLVSADYGASEGGFGINVDPKLPLELTTFTMPTNQVYFEFIPLREEDDQKQDKIKSTLLCKPVGLTEVKAGEEYEIVVTNFAGLYRCRVGDVVKVMGFHNSTPKLKFVRRRSLLLNINIDMNTEKDLELAVEAAVKVVSEEKVEVVDFTSHVDLSTEPGHYVIFWELSGEASDDVLNESCNCLDRSFVDTGYVMSRKVNGIGALELRIVRRGTFQKILEHHVSLGASISQVKTPRCVGPSNAMVLQILCGNVVKCYFSTAFG